MNIIIIIKKGYLVQLVNAEPIRAEEKEKL